MQWFFFMLIKFIYSQSEARKHVFKWLEPLIGGARGTDSGWYFSPCHFLNNTRVELHNSTIWVGFFFFFFSLEVTFMKTCCTSEFFPCISLSNVPFFLSVREKRMYLAGCFWIIIILESEFLVIWDVKQEHRYFLLPEEHSLDPISTFSTHQHLKS